MTGYAKREADCTPEELKLAQPLEPSEYSFEAWYMDDDTETDQREPHKQDPNVPCPPEKLKKLGILVRRMSAAHGSRCSRSQFAHFLPEGGFTLHASS